MAERADPRRLRLRPRPLPAARHRRRSTPGARCSWPRPTGSGKTVVAEHAVAKALAEGGKAFYTAPIKALSNQKYADLARRHGSERVGLLTGDNAINGDAPVVVMTTEVLRNMIYAGSPALDGLRYVVLDEVHFLQDAYRGPVWEEVIIHLPPDVRLVCLSATVSNAEELAEWIATVRGPDRGRHRGAAAGRAAEPLLRRRQEQPGAAPAPDAVDGRPNPEADRLDDEALHVRGRGQRGRPRRRFFTPRRVEVIERLQDEEMLPAITFIFSRKACDEARDACLDAGPAAHHPRRAGPRSARSSTSARPTLADADLDVLGFDRFLAGLEAGVAAHHAGMVPPFKEAVEACFVEGLIKAVFATETLALGVNMPARSVVIERLTKFTGERHELLTPGRVHPAHRPGRPAGDRRGRATPSCSGRRSSPSSRWPRWRRSRTYALRSAFRPTYNMAANLVRRYEPEQAHHLLNLSFAQFQADRAVVRLEARIERQQAAPRPPPGGGTVRARRRRGVPAAAGGRAGRTPARTGRGGASGALDRDRRPRSAALHAGRRRGGRRHPPRRPQRRLPQGPPAAPRRRRAQQAPHHRRGRPRPSRRGPSGTVELPCPYNPNNRAFQHQVGERLRRARLARRGHGDGSAEAPATGPTTRSTTRSSPPRPTRWRTAPTAMPTCGRPCRRERVERELARPAPPGPGAHGVARPALRPGAAPPRGVGLPRRLGAHRGGAGPGPHLPRGRPAGRRGADHRAARRPRRAVARRARVVLHLRAPRPRPAAGAAVPVLHGAGALPGRSSASSRRPERRRGGGRPPRRPALPDPGFVHLAHAWAAGGGLAERARGRGALGWRLRPQREAAHRPASGHRRRRAGRPPPRPGPGRRPTPCSAAWSRPPRPWRSTDEPEADW